MARAMKDSGIEWIGEIPEEWKVKKLKYISTFKQNKYTSAYDKLNYIGLENIISWTGKYTETDSEYDLGQYRTIRGLRLDGTPACIFPVILYKFRRHRSYYAIRGLFRLTGNLTAQSHHQNCAVLP